MIIPVWYYLCRRSFAKVFYQTVERKLRERSTVFVFLTEVVYWYLSNEVASPTTELRRRGNRGTITNVARVESSFTINFEIES